MSEERLARYRGLRGFVRHCLPYIRSGKASRYRRDVSPTLVVPYHGKKTGRCLWCDGPVESRRHTWHPSCVRYYTAARGRSHSAGGVVVLGKEPCAVCGGPPEDLDHRVAIGVAQRQGLRAWARAHLSENLQWLCHQCHLLKAKADFLHSGSRDIGNKVASHYIRRAKQEHEQAGTLGQIANPDLAWFGEGSDGFNQYIRDMRWCQRYASENRGMMMRETLNALRDVVYGSGNTPMAPETIDCHHNYTDQEQHDGFNIYVTRKGAINATEGRLGLIPGSMGTRSYVVRGKGNVASFRSAPHGAGRRMSRGEAKRQFDMADFSRYMKGIEVRHDPAFLDEIPGAYKDVDAVMRQSEDLVEVVHEFRQLVNVKGGADRRRRR